jgi:hypothetical protein
MFINMFGSSTATEWAVASPKILLAAHASRYHAVTEIAAPAPVSETNN